ncbi:MAG: hypothetical protein H6578_11965 [Chitinophagales bacterium]|nr:hypothetical protein [Chitinophagales bacterium]
MFKKNKKKLFHLLSIFVILIFSCVLFFPQLNGSKVEAGDMVSSDAKSKHIKEYMQNNNDLIYWNAAQFSGGPIYLLALGKKNNIMGYIDKAITFNHAAPIGLFFALGLVLYISLIFLNIDWKLSLVLSLVHMVSLMNFTLLEAGHYSKLYTLAYLPLILSGIIQTFKNRFISGGIFVAIGMSLAIYSGHVQMVYYLGISIAFFLIPLLIKSIRATNKSNLLKIIPILLVALLFGVLSNFSQLYSSLKFSEKTMRGGDVLEQEASPENKVGLDWEYAMNWSYTTKDFFNIIVPRIVGGGSQENISSENPLAKLLIQNGALVKNGKVAVPGYWSSMPFTSGGAYIGAGLFILFVISLVYLKNEYTIAFSLAFLVIFVLSLGSNFPIINKLFYNYFPMFDKFRAPSSVIAILPTFITIGTALGLQEIISAKDKKNMRFLLQGLSIGAGLIILILIIGNLSFSFLSTNDLKYDFSIQQIFIEGRKSLFNNDVFRSLLFTFLTAGLLILSYKSIIKKDVFLYILLAIVMSLDLIPISKRYFTEDNFVSKNKYEQNFQARPSDIQIANLEKKGRGFYRVLDLSVNTFNSAIPSVHHNQIGGYDPTKLQRYQDIIDYHIAKNNIKVLNMLNAKYIVNQKGEVQSNPNANGNAWFASNIKYVSTAKDEIESLNTIDNKTTAVINEKDFGNKFKTGNGSGSITLKEYQPDRLVYTSNSNEDELAVFSEIWYGGNPDWKAWIDGNEASIIRTDYILRAMEIPKGNHEIVMEFKPIPIGGIVSTIFSLLCILSIPISFYPYLKKQSNV